jgi:hypothetical protein
MLYFTDDEMAVHGPGDQPSVFRWSHSGANRKAKYEPLEPLTMSAGYLIGRDASKWVRDVPRYERLARTDIYPNIDIHHHTTKGSNSVE